jgi:hypothetical protein
MGPDAASAVSALVEALGDPIWFVRWDAVQALGKVGPEARSAVPALTACLEDRNDDVRRGAREALDRIAQVRPPSSPARHEDKPARVEQPIRNDPSDRRDAVPHEIVDEKTIDTPAKTEVAIKLLVRGQPSEASLRKLLNRICSDVNSRGSYRFHDQPNNIFIYAYTSRRVR